MFSHQDDGAELEKFDLPLHSRLSIQLRRLEKRILEAVVEYTQRCIENAETWSDDITTTDTTPADTFPTEEDKDVEEAMSKIDMTGN